MTLELFLNEPFHPISLNDQEFLEKLFHKFPQKLSGYTFANLASWNTSFDYKWTWFQDCTLLVSYLNLDDSPYIHLIQPVGDFHAKAQKILLNEIRQLPYPLKILNVSDEFLDQYPEFCRQFHDYADRNMANYLYRTQDLAFLSGRKFEKKRNLISQAESKYVWSCHDLTKDCGSCCRKILADIGTKNQPLLTKELERELLALNYIFEHFEKLHLKGCTIRIDNQPVAFSIYEPINSNTIDIHFEKAEKRFKGLYQIINRETAKRALAEGFELINREEDLGIEGLRKAKLSYNPAALINSHVLTFKN